MNAMNEQQRREIQDAVLARMASFEAAERAVDAWLWRLRRGEGRITHGHVDQYADAQ
jgi:hypothetical protein